VYSNTGRLNIASSKGSKEGEGSAAHWAERMCNISSAEDKRRKSQGNGISVSHISIRTGQLSRFNDSRLRSTVDCRAPATAGPPVSKSGSNGQVLAYTHIDPMLRAC